MPGPIIRTYKNGSIIYFENEKSENIYVLQKGRVVLISKSVDGKEEITDDAKLGEFFGVRSALGRYPREETAQVVGGASLLIFKVNEFEAYICQKPNLMMKMMKVFSNQLRQYHYKVREKLGEHRDTKSPSNELLNVGEVYHKIGQKEHAWYAYSKYVESYPTGQYIERAKQLLELAQGGGDYPSGMEDGIDEPPSSGGDGKNIKELFSKGEASLGDSKFEEAVKFFKEITEAKASNKEEEKIIEASYIYLGDTYNNMGKKDEAIEILNKFQSSYPNSTKLKDANYKLGEIYEKANDIPNAISCYKKVSSMAPEDDLTKKSVEKIGKLGG